MSCGLILPITISTAMYSPRANIYCLLGLYDKALKDLNYALKLDTTNSISILAIRDDIYRIIGRYDLTFADLESALRCEENIMALERRGM
ncbi:5190_t:CDS:1, partial [Dentiscutata heterogama]